MTGICLADNTASVKVMERCGFIKLYQGIGKYQGEEREICKFVYYLSPKDILKIVAGQFSNLTIKVLDVFAEGGMVTTRILYDGIHTGTCMGIPATGKHITFEALENFKVENGKITESWGYWPDKEIEQKLKSEQY